MSFWLIVFDEVDSGKSLGLVKATESLYIKSYIMVLTSVSDLAALHGPAIGGAPWYAVDVVHDLVSRTHACNLRLSQ